MVPILPSGFVCSGSLSKPMSCFLRTHTTPSGLARVLDVNTAGLSLRSAVARMLEAVAVRLQYVLILLNLASAGCMLIIIQGLPAIISVMAVSKTVLVGPVTAIGVILWIIVLDMSLFMVVLARAIL